MKFIVIAQPTWGYAASTEHALRSLGHEVISFEEKPFYTKCTYLERRLYKLGMKSLEKSYNNRYYERLIALADEHRDAVLLFLGGWLETPKLLERLAGHRRVLIMWDSVRRGGSAEWQATLPFYDERYAFEYDDIAYTREKFGIAMKYLPLGYDDRYFYPQAVARDIDVTFIGSPSQERLQLMEAVARHVASLGKRLYVAGRWYDTRFWKKRAFRRRYPYLFQAVDNRILTQEQTAAVYRRSKIVLNSNTPGHKSISPRTLEIMATGTMQLMNEGQEPHGLIDLERDLVTYQSTEDLLAKIDYYLEHEDERLAIAQHAQRTVVCLSQRELLCQVIEDIGGNTNGDN